MSSWTILVHDLLHQDPKEFTKPFNQVWQLLSELEFIVCSQVPVQSVVFFRALLNSINITISVPHLKLHELELEAHGLKTKGACTIQELSALLCRVTQVSKIGIETRPLYYRNLQQQLIRAVHRYGHCLCRQFITYTAEAMTHLSWWISTKSTTEKMVHR